MLRTTIKDLPQFADPATAEADGYRTIGDSITGDEHYVNWSYVNDGNILDPNKPESLVYEMKNNKKTLVAAMYMLPFGSGFGDVPDVGGALTQWHVHRDLCLTDDPVQKVVSTLTSIDGVPARHRPRPATRRCSTCGSSRTRADRSPPSRASARVRSRRANPPVRHRARLRRLSVHRGELSD